MVETSGDSDNSARARLTGHCISLVVWKSRPGWRTNQMQNYEQTIFISYAWGGEREEIVNKIDESLQKRGLKITRDKRDLGYKGSIKEFMERIGQGNCVIVVVSDKYLRSHNCMFELVEIAENKQFQDRIFPVVLADADIYNPVKQLQYIKYWEQQIAELKDSIKGVDPTNLQGIYESLNLYDRIRDNISKLIAILSDMNTLTPDMHRDTDFSALYDAIEKRMKEKPSTVPTENNPAQPKSDVNADKGSVAVGNLQIGGNVTGNIVIGNNNQISNK
jgi:hypothetical protein